MKKFLISTTLIIIFGVYVTYNDLTSSNTQQPVTVAPPSSTSAFSGTPTANSASTAAGSAPPTTTTAPVETRTPTTASQKPVAPTSNGKYVDGTYTGSASNAYYGNIQVEANISGGKLTNVTFLQYPNDRSTSRYINQQAMPELKAEAIQAQSANVDGVSGASDSSAAFKQSLASALSQAQA